MAFSEFELIEHFFKRRVSRDDVVIGVGDDGAVVRCPVGQELVLAMDTLVCGQHFDADTPPQDIAHKALAVNLSDLAAMGATPAWATLALTLPESNEQWLSAFSDGLYSLAERFNVALVGGDTTRGPLTITVQVHGFVPAGGALTRRGASSGDLIYVTGYLGDAAAAWLIGKNNLRVEHATLSALCTRLHRPEPRLDVGRRLLGLASSAIDISDGLSADLGHILTASGVGARLWSESIPLSAAFRVAASGLDKVVAPQHPAQAMWPVSLTWALSGGDDYELCFTVPAAREPDVHRLEHETGCMLSRVGIVEVQPGLRIEKDSSVTEMLPSGYQHF